MNRNTASGQVKAINEVKRMESDWTVFTLRKVVKIVPHPSRHQQFTAYLPALLIVRQQCEACQKFLARLLTKQAKEHWQGTQT
jgi:hypothetical protein